MLTTVKVNQIKPNPFQVRQHFEPPAIEGLARAIKHRGLWAGALRGRSKNGFVELAFGHRRLAAIQKLGWKEVDVDLVDLSDEEMAAESLIENLQREDLNDIDRADGIRSLLEKNSIKEVATQLGFDESYVRTLADIAELEEPIKKIVAAGQLAGQAALHAHAIGGRKMVEVAAQEGMSYHKVVAVSKALHAIPEEKLRAKVKQAASRGHIKSAHDVQVKAAAYARGKTPVPNLGTILVNLRMQVQETTRYLEDLLPHKEAVRREPSFAKLDDVCVRLHETMQKIRPRPAEKPPVRLIQQEFRKLG
jgi:ParB/RepB/Spo0J family partition protein